MPKPTELFSIGILMGHVYYNDIMSTERIKIHKGFYIIKSKFGWMINRRSKKREGTKDKNVMLIMADSANKILSEIHQFTPVEPSLKPTPDTDEFWKLETLVSFLLRKLRMMME